MKEQSDKHWYVLYTAPRAEKKIHERFLADGYEVFLPVVSQKRKWSDRIKTLVLPLFPSYLFIRCAEYELRSKISSYTGIVGYVRFNGVPAVVRDSEIESIREFLQLAENHQIISEGDSVSILSGPFEKVSGKVVQLSQNIAYLYIEALGATVYVKLENIEKI